MVYVTRIIDEDVLPKIDAQYVMSKLSDVAMDAVIVFICTNENWRKDLPADIGGKHGLYKQAELIVQQKDVS